MSLKSKELNPLEVLNSRKLLFIPHHFQCISIFKKVDIKMLEQWILYNLNSRYAIKQTYLLDSTKKVVNSILLGLEDPKEATIFILSCPYFLKD